ncbi:hypothetical protein ACF09E_13725 [Streptomyces sp. NPDC014891]
MDFLNTVVDGIRTGRPVPGDVRPAAVALRERLDETEEVPRDRRA